MLSHLLASHCHGASAVGADSVRLPWVSVSFPTPGSQAGSSLGSVKHCSAPLHSVSVGLGGAEAAVGSLEAVRSKAQVWRRCEQIPTLVKSPNLFLWDGTLCATPRESAVAEYAKSCREGVSGAGPAPHK